MNEQFNEQQSLQLIESMINKAKNNFSESGTLYLLWGFVVFICGLYQFISLHFFNNSNSYYIWFLTWLVVIYQLFFLARRKKKETAKTYHSINPAILVIYGMPTFLSGIILKFRPLIIGGISCWALSAGSVMVPYDFQLLFICTAVLLAWIIPGFLLRKKYLKQQ